MRVVQHFRGWTPGEQWVIGPDPITTIGTADGPEAYVLSGVVGAAIVGRDQIVIADGSSRQIRYFDSQGDHLRTVGGEGGGPSEFQILRFLGSGDGDSVYAADPLLRKGIVLDPDGELVRTAAFAGELGAANPVGVVEGGIILLERQAGEGDGREARVRRRPYLVRASGWQGNLLWDVGPVPGTETANVSGTSGTIPFGRALHVAARGDRMAVGNDDAFRIRVYDGEGQKELVIAVESDPVEVGPGDFDAWMDEALAEHEDEGFRQRVRDAAAQMPDRETVPLFRVVKFGPAGQLWVLKGDRPANPLQTWFVFDSTGVMIAEATYPDRGELLHVGEKHILMLHRDELHVERVQVHPIRRTSAETSGGPS